METPRGPGCVWPAGAVFVRRAPRGRASLHHFAPTASCHLIKEEPVASFPWPLVVQPCRAFLRGDSMSKPSMTLATMVGVGGCLGLVMAAPAAGEDLKIAEFDYFRLQASIGAVEAPEVEEDRSEGAGTSTSS